MFSYFVIVTPNTLALHTPSYAHQCKPWLLGMYQTLLRTVGNSRNIFGIKDDSQLRLSSFYMYKLYELDYYAHTYYNK